MRLYSVCIFANADGVTFTEMTPDLRRCILAHRHGEVPFTATRAIRRLLFLEFFPDRAEASAKEKEIKCMTQSQIHALIEIDNPLWYDLAPGVGQKDTRLPDGRSVPGYPGALEG